MILTKLQIDNICDSLHETVQFYDSTGTPANNLVLDQIKNALTGLDVEE
jgi:hypothetical protein